MKKTLNNIFDEASPNEIENLVNQNTASDVSADILSSIKNKVYAKTGIAKTKSRRPFVFHWQSFAAIAACLLLIVGVIFGTPSNDDPIINPPNGDVGSISVISSGNMITGKQQLEYGDPVSDSVDNADMLAPGFEIQTVIEAEVIEVLPDTYYYASSYYRPFHVARLRVIDQIHGEGLPEEIFLCYPYYDTKVFEGYERFILSLEQVGIENYMLVNDTQRRIDYFSNMFEVIVTRDLGYGSVIAFNEGKIDERFWDKVTYHHSGDTIKNMMGWQLYPVEKHSTIRQVKEKILGLVQAGHVYDPLSTCNYITADDIFISAEGKAVQTYVAPSPTSVFRQSIYIRENRIIAVFTRVINGFLSDEVIIINGYTGDNGNILMQGSEYTAAQLAEIPDIGEALANMKLAELVPPHIEITKEMNFRYSTASGVYRKAEGKVYGIICVVWYYKCYNESGYSYKMDDMYYLYDENGTGSIVERDELKEIIGDDMFIQSFPYVGYIAWD